ncbi:hypothetical protein BN1263170055 [Stenotrophomonas indicatrix]|nr:hypothetical protein BN1263170055 [Stenotrophomonas indicatrix]
MTINSISVKPFCRRKDIGRSPACSWPRWRTGLPPASGGRMNGQIRATGVKPLTSRPPPPVRRGPRRAVQLPSPRLRQHLVAGLVFAGDLHPALLDEGTQQRVQGLHHVGVAMDLERPELLDAAHAVFLHVAGDDAREGPAQIGCQRVRRTPVVQVQRRHRLVGRHERLLVFPRNLDGPVEEERILLRQAMLAHALDAGRHLLGHRHRVADDDFVALGRGVAQGQADETVDLLEVRRSDGRAGQDQRERQVLVLLAQQDAEQVQDLFGGTHATGEHDDAVADADEGLKALLDVRHDHQVVDDRVRRLGGDDARLGQADVARHGPALLGVGDGGALHRALHRARAAAGTDVQAAQAQLVTDLLGIQVLVARNRVTAPADHQVRVTRVEDACVAQQPEHRIGDALGRLQLGRVGRAHLDGHVRQVTDHREQQLGHAADDLAIDERHRRRIGQVDAHAAILLCDLDIKIGVKIARGARIIGRTATGQHGQRAAAQQLVHATTGGVAQARNLGPRQHIQSTTRVDPRVLHRQRPRCLFIRCHIHFSASFKVSDCTAAPLKSKTAGKPDRWIGASRVRRSGTASAASAPRTCLDATPMHNLPQGLSPERETAGFPRPFPFTASGSDGSELVLQGQLHRPARHTGVALVVVVFLDGRGIGGAGEVVDVLAGCRIDTCVAGHAGGGVETVIFNTAPLLVEQVADIHDVQRQLTLVLLHEAREFLGDVQVEAVHPLGTERVCRSNLAAVLLQLRVGSKPVEEGLLHRRTAGELDVARAIRHVEQVVEVTGASGGGGIAVHVVVVDVAERTTRTTFVEQAHGGVVVAEERLLPVDRTGHAVLDRVARIIGHVLVGGTDQGAAPVGGVLRAGQRADFLRGGVGVGQRPAPVLGQRLVQTGGELAAAALVGVLHEQHVAHVRGTIELAARTVAAFTDGAVGAGARRVARRIPVELATILADAGRCNARSVVQVQALEVDRALDLGVQELSRRNDAIPRQLMIEGDVGLPHRRQLQVRRSDVHVLTSTGTRSRDVRRIGVRGENAGLVTNGVLGVVQAGVLVGTCQPHVRGRATEQAHAAAQLGRTIAVEGVVEAEARLHQLAVGQLGVVVAVQFHDARVVQLLRAEVRHVDADAGLHGQVAVDGPAVLDEQAGVLQRVLGRDVVVAAAGARRTHNVLVDATCSEVAEVVEHIRAVDVTTVVVQQVVVGVVEAELDGVVADVPGGGTEGAQLLALDRVDVRVLLGTEVQRVIAAGAKTTDLDLRQARRRGTDRGVFLVRDLELGREILGPVAEQLAHPGFIGLRLLVPEGAQRNRAVADLREADNILLELVVTHRGTVVLVDVPVDLQRVLFDLGLVGRGVERTCVEAVTGRDLLRAGDVGIGDGALAVRRIGQADARGRTLHLFVVGEEEQLVLDDRAAEGHAVGLFVIKTVEADIVQVLADHVLVAVRVIHGAAEVVGTRLGHRIDHRARTAGNGGVVVGDVDVDFLDRIHRHRLTLGRQVVGFQAERIAGTDAIDADRVVTGVLTTDRDRTVGLADLRDARIEADVILDVAVHRRQRLQRFAVDVGAGAHLVGAEQVAAHCGSHDLDGIQIGGGDIAGQVGVDRVDLVQVEVHALFGLGALTRLGDGDGVRTTHAQAARVVTTRRIGGRTRNRARFGVGDGDFSTSNRRARIGHDLAADTGRGALGEGGSGGERSDETKGELGHPEWVSHCSVASMRVGDGGKKAHPSSLAGGCSDIYLGFPTVNGSCRNG